MRYNTLTNNGNDMAKDLHAAAKLQLKKASQLRADGAKKEIWIPEMSKAVTAYEMSAKSKNAAQSKKHQTIANSLKEQIHAAEIGH